MRYQSTKTYGCEIGWSCAFRQWRAQSHCRFLHGYAIGVRLTFEAERLDSRNWVVDFGGLKDLRKEIEDHFDHRTLVAKDDPDLAWFQEAERLGLIQLQLVDATGCEAFSYIVSEMVMRWLLRSRQTPRVRLVSVEVFEHGANSALVVQ